MNINGVLVTAGDVAVLQGSEWFTVSVLNAYTSQGEVVVRNVVGGSGLRNLLFRSWRTPMLVFHPKCCLSAAWSLLYERAALVSDIFFALPTHPNLRCVTRCSFLRVHVEGGYGR